MFYNAAAFDKPIGDWDVGSVRNMEVRRASPAHHGLRGGRAGRRPIAAPRATYSVAARRTAVPRASPAARGVRAEHV